MKQKTVENKKKFGRDYPDIFKLKNLVKKQAYAIKSDIKSASRGGVSFPMPGKSPLRCVDATTVRDRTLHSAERDLFSTIFTVLPSSFTWWRTSFTW